MSDSIFPNLLVGKSLWGVAEAGDESKWDAMFARIKAEGFSMVETILIFDANLNPGLFRELLDKHKLELTIQLHTASDWSKFDYCTSSNVAVHVASFRTLVQDCLNMRPKVINVHSGHDSWSIAEAVSYFQQVLAIEKELLVGAHSEVTLVHETHRQRLLYSPYQARDIFVAGGEDLKDLKVNCDLSHWVCVCEKVFGEDARDAWWPGVLSTVAEHCRLVHARVGHAEGPQVVDPRNSQAELKAHMDWWQVLWKAQKRAGVQSMVTTEHGPEPYQTYDTPKHSNGTGGKSAMTDEEKSALLWDINSFVRVRVQEGFARVL
jgi:sugar phosphate isomerase/epimerase